MNTAVDQQEQKMSAKYKSDLPNELIEQQTKKIPNLAFIGLAVAAIFGSAALTAANKKSAGNFVGLWVPTILIFGVYNKMVKLEDEILRRNMH